MANAIPIANIYYLLAYAWNHWADSDMVDVDRLKGTDTTNLLALLLDAATRHAIRRGLHRDYHTYEQEMPGIRGRLLIVHSKRRLLFEHGRAACAVDELDYASVPNRIVKAMLGLLHVASGIDESIRDQIGLTLRELRQVPHIDLSSGLFRRVRLSRSNAHYTFMLSLCELAFDCLLPNPSGSTTRFRDFSEDDAWMHDLFEEFVRNFYHAHADSQGWTCLGRTQIEWDALPKDDLSRTLLPRMATDVTLERGKRTLIVDCKYYREALTGRYTPKLNSNNLYQIWSYVSQQRRSSVGREYEGLLVYPTVHREFIADYQIDGNRIRAATLDLDQPWMAIRQHLLGLLQ